LADLVSTRQELHELGVGFISLSEALDFATPTRRAMAGMLAVFAEFEQGILRKRVKAGIAEAHRRHSARPFHSITPARPEASARESRRASELRGLRSW
jgi:putative DNA-invertase from lambdoid prophage Rac